MSTLPDPQQQHYSGTYFVQDRRNEEELLRLAEQDRLVTASMGGVLPEQAAAQHVDDRIELHVMDALGVLDFPDASFDLVNLRFALSFVRTWDWPRLLREFLRVVRPGGVVRLTDEEVIQQSTSPASMQFCEMLLCALYRAGHLYAQESTGLTAHLAPLLSQHGYQQVQTRVYALQYPTNCATSR